MAEGEAPESWVALEANPEILNKFIHGLGVPANWEFCDVFGTDPDLLAMVPQPAIGVLLLFPISENYERHRKEQQEKIQREGQRVSNNAYFTKQTIGNACGTIGVIHTILNNAANGRIALEEGWFKEFLERTRALSPEERAASLVRSNDIRQAHAAHASEGQSRAPEAEADIDLHFVALVQVDGDLYEFDGRKPFPVNWGPSADGNLLNDAAKVMGTMMELNPGEMRFSMVALAAAGQD